MKFQKGKSGNPNGRPKIELEDGRTLSSIARESTPEAIMVLLELILGPTTPAAVKMKAVIALVDRGWGRPKAALGLGVPEPERPLDRAHARDICRKMVGNLPSIQAEEDRENAAKAAEAERVAAEMRAQGIEPPVEEPFAHVPLIIGEEQEIEAPVLPANPTLLSRIQQGDIPRSEIGKSITLAMIARDFTDMAIASLKSLMLDPNAPSAVRLTASTTLLDRGWGCPKTNLNTSRFVPRTPEQEKEYWRFFEREVLGVTKWTPDELEARMWS